MRPLSLIRWRLSDTEWVVMEGELDAATTRMAAEDLEEALGAAGHVVIDARGLTFVDLGGLRLLSGVLARAREAGADVSLIPCRLLRRLATLSGLTAVLAAEVTVEAALAAPRARGRGARGAAARREHAGRARDLEHAYQELSADNADLREAGADLREENAYLASVLAGGRGGLVVLDRRLAVRAWSRVAEERWGPGAQEAIGRSFLRLGTGLPVRALHEHVARLAAAGAGGERIVTQAVERGGRTVRVEIAVSAVAAASGVPGVMLVIDETDDLPPAPAPEPLRRSSLEWRWPAPRRAEGPGPA